MLKENLTIQYVNPDDLVFADYNPRKASDKQFNDLLENIKTFGFVDPVLVNKADNRKNIIIGGHFRVRVAKHLEMKQVPVVYLDIPDIEKEKELNVRLNKNSGSFDFDMLANNFNMDDLLSWGFEDYELGLDNKPMDFSNKEIDTDELSGVSKPESKIICPECGHEFEL